MQAAMIKSSNVCPLITFFEVIVLESVLNLCEQHSVTEGATFNFAWVMSLRVSLFNTSPVCSLLSSGFTWLCWLDRAYGLLPQQKELHSEYRAGFQTMLTQPQPIYIDISGC